MALQTLLGTNKLPPRETWSEAPFGGCGGWQGGQEGARDLHGKPHPWGVPMGVHVELHLRAGVCLT